MTLLDFVKSDQQFFCEADRNSGGGYTVASQLSPDCYVSLDGRKVTIGEKRVTFRRWVKGEMDRMYVTVWTRGNKVEPGYFEVLDFSGMTPDANGHTGLIRAMFDFAMYEETARAVVQAVGL